MAKPSKNQSQLTPLQDGLIALITHYAMFGDPVLIVGGCYRLGQLFDVTPEDVDNALSDLRRRKLIVLGAFKGTVELRPE